MYAVMKNATKKMCVSMNKVLMNVCCYALSLHLSLCVSLNPLPPLHNPSPPHRFSIDLFHFTLFLLYFSVARTNSSS